uniref:7TM GPCR serpentine receptor class x (Srx) domain-containing protein n=1 Tax=Panagrolaimus davidi TaxID=227884 RepID=A0A914PSI6_9BILA
MALESLVITIFILGVLIIFASFISLRIICKTAILQNAFGYMCAAQSIAEAIYGGCFVFWATPVMAFFPEIQQSFFGYVFGQTFLYVFYASIWLHLCKSINRSIALIFPIQYYKQFTITIGKIFIGIALVLALISSSTIFQYKCNFYFHPTLFKWKLRFYPECWEMPFFDQISMAIVVVGAVTCFSTLAYLCLYVFWYHFANLAETLTATVILKTITWETFHLSNELIFIYFTIKGSNGGVPKVFENLWFTKAKPVSSILAVI